MGYASSRSIAAVATDSSRYSSLMIMILFNEYNLFTCFPSPSCSRLASDLRPELYIYFFNASFTDCPTGPEQSLRLLCVDLLILFLWVLLVLFFRAGPGRNLIDKRQRQHIVVDESQTKWETWSRLLKPCVNLFVRKFVWKWAKRMKLKK